MHPGDENGAVILDERMAQAKAKRNSFAMGMLISAAAGIFGLILTAIIADSVSVSLIVAVIADRTMMRKKQNFVTLRKNTGNTKKILFCLHRKSGKYRL